MTQAQTLITATSTAPTPTHGEPATTPRPRLHFTPQKNWINDPNGLVFFEGEYHLFYQYNPFGKGWGHMSWGHAVSPDLLDWTELEIAIPEAEFMVFSGSAMVDWDNTSGLGDGVRPPLLAFLTTFDEPRKRQHQSLAYSHDRGRTWSMYDGNPIIDLDMENHRDPNVFRHEPSGAWIMAVALSQLHQIEFYRSTDLLSWTRASVFGPAGSTSGQWECPALIEVPDEHATGVTRWVLKIDVDVGLVEGGSGAQYFVGNFDGHVFTPDADDNGPIARIADHGRDFYAAIAWHDLPVAHTHPVWLGWMSNHQTGKDYPTHPWVGAMTIPRELFVFQARDGWRLGQRPVAELRSALTAGDAIETLHIEVDQPSVLATLPLGGAWLGHLTVESKALGPTEFRLADPQGAILTIAWSPRKGTIRVEQDGRSYTAELDGPGSTLDLTLLVDTHSIELFAEGGRAVLTHCLFPAGPLTIYARPTKTPVDIHWTSGEISRSPHS